MDNIADNRNLILEQALDEGISIESVNTKESLKFGFENLRSLRRILVHHADLDGNISRKMANNTEFPNIFFSLCFSKPVEKIEMMECIGNESLQDFLQSYEIDGDIINQKIFSNMWQTKGGLFEIIFDDVMNQFEIVSVSDLIRILPSIFCPRYVTNLYTYILKYLANFWTTKDFCK
jgi:hypothetical protein